MKHIRSGLIAAAVVALLATPTSASAAGSASISGTVIDAETKEPIPGICANTSWSTQDGPETGSDGTYTVAVAPGTYTLVFRDCNPVPYRDFYYENQEYFGGFSFGEGHPVSVDAGEHQRHISVGMVPRGSLSLVVTGQGSPTDEVAVSYWQVLEDGSRQLAINNYGTLGEPFEINLFEGQWVLAFGSRTTNQYEVYRDVLSGQPSDEAATPVWVVTGRVTGPLELVLGGPDSPPPAKPDPLDPVGDFLETTFENDILWLLSEGITTGCDTFLEFCPDEEVTRGQMAAFLVRALDLTDTDPDIEFSDDNDSVFQSDIEKLATAGITTGCGGDRFCPDDNVTRGQMAAFLVRALDYTDRGDTDFTDDNNSVFEADIERLAAAGVTAGCGPTTFCPNDNVTRGQMAAFLRRALGGGVLYPGEAEPIPIAGVLRARPNPLEVSR